MRDIIPVFRNLAVMVRVAYPVQDGLTTQRGTGAPQQIAKVIGLTAFARLLRSFYLLQHSLDRGKVARSQARSGKSPLRADAVRRRGDQIEPRRAWRGWLYVSHPPCRAVHAAIKEDTGRVAQAYALEALQAEREERERRRRHTGVDAAGGEETRGAAEWANAPRPGRTSSEATPPKWRAALDPDRQIRNMFRVCPLSAKSSYTVAGVPPAVHRAGAMP